MMLLMQQIAKGIYARGLFLTGALRQTASRLHDPLTEIVEGGNMAYLLARCPMLGCNHRNPVCDLRSDHMPGFEPGVYVVVKCAKCGELFREPASRLELSHSPAPGPGPRDMESSG